MLVQIASAGTSTAGTWVQTTKALMPIQAIARSCQVWRHRFQVSTAVNSCMTVCRYVAYQRNARTEFLLIWDHPSCLGSL
jgi:hypothetical protein